MNRALVQIAVDWGERAFGREHILDSKVRGLRLAEEAIELAQALDVPQEQMRLLVETVYGRPKGHPLQEIGGVQVCLGVLCSTLGIDPETAFEIEVRRVLAKPPEHFAQRNKQKLDLGLTGKARREQYDK